jgi:hypothetical protein
MDRINGSDIVLKLHQTAQGVSGKLTEQTPLSPRENGRVAMYVRRWHRLIVGGHTLAKVMMSANRPLMNLRPMAIVSTHRAVDLRCPADNPVHIGLNHGLNGNPVSKTSGYTLWQMEAQRGAPRHITA